MTDLDPLTIRMRGDVLNNFPATGTCIWCGTVCWTTAITPFRADLGAVPLHLFCTQAIRDAYRLWKTGGLMPPEYVAGMQRMAAAGAPQLEAGK